MGVILSQTTGEMASETRSTPVRQRRGEMMSKTMSKTVSKRDGAAAGAIRRRLGRRAALLGAALGGAMAIAGGRSGAPSQGSAAGGQPAPLTFLSRDAGSDLEPYKQRVEKFNARQSRVRVTHELATGNFLQKFQTLVAAGTLPDVTYMHSENVPTFAPAGVLASLDGFARKDRGALDGLVPAALETYRWKGAIFGVPDVATSLVMYVNRSLFTRAGVPVPGERWTWADYVATVQRLTNAGRADGVFGATGYEDNFPRFTVLWQNDADILSRDRTQVTIDRPEAIEALTWIADQMHRLRVHATPADRQGKGTEAFFLEGKAAMLPSISSRMGIIARGAQFDVEVVHLPQGKRRVTRTACGGTAMCRATKHPEAAWELEKFFATDEFQWLITKAGGIIFPAHKSVVHAPELFAAGPFPRSPKVTVDALAYARTEPYTPRYIELTGAMNAELNRIWSGESSVKDAVTRARAAMEPILAEVVAQMK